MSTEFRFILQKYARGSKITCSACGHRACFTRYIDTEGSMTFPSFVGRCDREDKCGYHFTPKMYLTENPLAKKDLLDRSRADSFLVKSRDVPMLPQEPSFIYNKIMEHSKGNYDINPLHRYLCGVFGKDETDRLFLKYNVGTSYKYKGSTIFWQVDRNNKVRSGKIMRYDPETGHRIKDGRQAVSWMHTMLKIPDFNLIQCLFGEHLLASNPDAKVIIVESENTAVIAAGFKPQHIWLATGGKNGCFNYDSMRVLIGRDVILIPDLGAMGAWTKKAEILNLICSSVKVSNLIEKLATDEERSQGLDIADFLLMANAERNNLFPIQ